MARLFAIGVVVLFLGLQFRVVDTFVLNEKASEIVNRRMNEPAAKVETAYETFSDPYFDPPPPAVAATTKREIKPPRWLGYSFLSIGAILVLTCPLRR